MKNEKGNSNQNPQSLTIPGVDVQQGIVMTGGTLTLYRQVLALFRKDAEDRLPLLQTMPEAGTLPAFIIQVHALKSASASLGAMGFSAEAARLEAAGKATDMAFIQENLSGFVEHLTELVRGIDAALEAGKTSGGQANATTSDITVLLPLLRELESALKSEKDSEIDRIMNTLNEKPLDSKMKNILEQISEQVLISEFDDAGKILKNLIHDV